MSFIEGRVRRTIQAVVLGKPVPVAHTLSAMIGPAKVKSQGFSGADGTGQTEYLNLDVILEHGALPGTAIIYGEAGVKAVRNLLGTDTKDKVFTLIGEKLPGFQRSAQAGGQAGTTQGNLGGANRNAIRVREAYIGNKADGTDATPIWIDPDYVVGVDPEVRVAYAAASGPRPPATMQAVEA